jgi:hypothetical protein
LAATFLLGCMRRGLADTGQPAGRVEAGGRREDTEEREQTGEADERAGRDPAAH